MKKLASVTSSLGKWYLKFILLRRRIMEITDCVMLSFLSLQDLAPLFVLYSKLLSSSFLHSEIMLETVYRW